MSRFLFALILAASLAPRASGRDRTAEQRAEAYQTLQKYLDARWRGAEWKEFAPLVAWDEDQEPRCVGLVRSVNITEVRLRGDRLALGTVMVYRLGEYCPEALTFTPQIGLDKVLYQLRRTSIVWQVEKTNRPGANVEWKRVRDQLKERAFAPTTPVADTAKLALAVEQIEKAAAVVEPTPADRK